MPSRLLCTSWPHLHLFLVPGCRGPPSSLITRTVPPIWSSYWCPCCLDYWANWLAFATLRGTASTDANLLVCCLVVLPPASSRWVVVPQPLGMATRVIHSRWYGY